MCSITTAYVCQYLTGKAAENFNKLLQFSGILSCYKSCLPERKEDSLSV